jgi:hypothetical protein
MLKFFTKDQPEVHPRHYNSSDLSPANFFLFPKVKEQWANITLAQDTFNGKLGTGHQDHLHLRGHCRLPPMVRVKQKVCLHRL